MASLPCLRCFVRPKLLSTSSLSLQTTSRLAPISVSFSTSTTLSNVEKKKKKGIAKVGNRERQSFKLKKKKKGKGLVRANPPRVGERKAMRRRIVLSNLSALEVPDMTEMSLDAVKDDTQIGKVVSLPGEIVDQLRALQAFKKTQSWSFFRRPSVLVRKETVELAKEMDSIDKKTLRRIVTGDRGSGKSMLLLQSMAIAFLKGWVVVYIPEAAYLVDGSSDYRPVQNTKPVIYEQGEYSMEALRRIIAANPLLKKIPVKLQHQLGTTLNAKASLYDLCDIGVEDSEIAPTVLSAFFKELGGPEAPPALLAVDGLAHLMGDSKYTSPSLEPIHAHELAIVDWFMSYLSGEKSLPNGGMILASTSGSNDPKAETLRLRIRQLEIKQALEKGLPSPAADANLPDPMLPFLLATGQQPNPVPQPDPYFKHDERVFKVLGSAFGVVAGNKTANENEVVVRNIQGLSRDEARGLMEYWARSGMMRQEIDDRLINEKWTLAAGGVVGDLERGCLRSRV